MQSEAQKRASAKYRTRMMKEGKLKHIRVEFSGDDLELYDYLQEHKPMATLVKGLIREHMERSREKPE